VGGDGLLVCRPAMTEQATLVRAHLEEAQVLPVPSDRREARLAPGNGDRLAAIPAEHVADRNSWGSSSEPAGTAIGVAGANRTPVVRDLLRDPGQTAARAPECGRCDRAVLTGAEKPAVLTEEAEGAAVLVHRLQLQLEPRLQREVARRLLSGLSLYRASPLARELVVRCRRGLSRENERAQANEWGSQNVKPPGGRQGRGSPTEEPLVSARKTLAEAIRASTEVLTEC
jgi:hypothetical protein